MKYTPSSRIPPTAPSIFISDYPPPVPGTEIPETIPGSAGGVVESVKKAVVSALRESIANTSLSFPTKGTQVHIELEYPMAEEQYPGIWVQFATTRLQRMGLAQEFWVKEGENWNAVQEWQVQGRVTMTILALSNLERDRIADSLIMLFAFSRTPEPVITKPHKNTNKYRQFITALDENPYVAMTVNTDILTGGGQSVNVGVPWQPDILAYTDAYSFDVIGNFNYVFGDDGTYSLARIERYNELVPEGFDLNSTIYNNNWPSPPSGGPSHPGGAKNY